MYTWNISNQLNSQVTKATEALLFFQLCTELSWWHTQMGVCLPMQGTKVRSLVQEDSTRHGATELVI